jgi:hypothetical protein
MTDPKWTPGPWRTAAHGSRVWGTDGKGWVEVAQVGNFSDKELLPTNEERWKADANLMAAAPELYEALNAIIRDLPSRRDWLDPVAEEFARAALSKARGET